MYKQQYKAYANATQTVGKTRQVIMLYDAAIRNLQQAKEAIQEKRVEDRFTLLNKAAEIIFGLQGCLDFEKGDKVANVLYDFYAMIDARIIVLHRTQNIELCEQLIAELKSMRDVWSGIDATSPDGGENPLSGMPASVPQEAGNVDDSGITISA